MPRKKQIAQSVARENFGFFHVQLMAAQPRLFLPFVAKKRHLASLIPCQSQLRIARVFARPCQSQVSTADYADGADKKNIRAIRAIRGLFLFWLRLPCVGEHAC